MPLALTYPGVYVEEVSSGVRTITGVATSIALFIGWTARGPVDRAVRLTSFSDFERQFGGLDLRTLLPYAVKQFYDNGGADAYVIRVAHKDAKAASGTSGNLTVTASSPGAWSKNYRFKVTRRTDAADRFKLEVLRTTKTLPTEAVVESFENLSMSSADGRFVETVINGRSGFIRVSVTAPAATPADGSSELEATTAGDDGPVLDPNSTVPATATAFHLAVTKCFGPGSLTDRIDLFNLVCVPGESDPATVAALQGHCQARRAFLLVDCLETDTVTSMGASLIPGGVNLPLLGTNARNSGLYFPWVTAPDPQREGACATSRPAATWRACSRGPTVRGASGRRPPEATPASTAPSAWPSP